MTVNRREFLGAAAIVPLVTIPKVVSAAPIEQTNPKNLPVAIYENEDIKNWQELWDLAEKTEKFEPLFGMHFRFLHVWVERDNSFLAPSSDGTYFCYGECHLSLRLSKYSEGWFFSGIFSPTDDSLSEKKPNHFPIINFGELQDHDS